MSSNKKSAFEIEREKQEEENVRKQEEKKRERDDAKAQKMREIAELEERKIKNKEAGEEAQRKLAKKKNNPYFYYYVTFGILAAVTLYVVVMLFINQATPLHKVMIIDEQKIEEHNQKHPWKQGGSKFFEASTLAEAKKIISNHFTSHSNLSRCPPDDYTVIPESFDYRTKWPQCVLPPKNQQITCSSSYAVAAAQTASERLCIASKAQKLINLSAMELVSCDKNNSGCKSGFLNHSNDYMRATGLVEESCFPYKIENGEPAKCENICANPVRHKIDNYCVIGGEDDIKREIFKNGPVLSAMNVHVDFLNYKGGVYAKGEEVAKFKDFHPIKIIGWGVENGSENEPNIGNKYWIIQNSWGEDWGEQGYARISSGQELFFDQYGYALRVPSDKEAPKKKPEVKKEPEAAKVEKPVEESLDLEDPAVKTEV